MILLQGFLSPPSSSYPSGHYYSSPFLSSIQPHKQWNIAEKLPSDMLGNQRTALIHASICLASNEARGLLSA